MPVSYPNENSLTIQKSASFAWDTTIEPAAIARTTKIRPIFRIQSQGCKHRQGNRSSQYLYHSGSAHNGLKESSNQERKDNSQSRAHSKSADLIGQRQGLKDCSKGAASANDSQHSYRTADPFIDVSADFLSVSPVTKVMETNMPIIKAILGFPIKSQIHFTVPVPKGAASKSATVFKATNRIIKIIGENEWKRTGSFS